MINNYIQGFRLINAIVRSLPAANIETLLTDEVRASAFTKACGFYSQQSRFLEAPLALQNLALSAKAYALLPEGVRLGILNDQTAIQNLTATILGEDPATFGFDDISQFVGDQAVMSVVFASDPASQVIAASATAMNAIVNSGAALSVLWGKAPAIAALKISDVAKKAFVDSTHYVDAFKPAVLNNIILGENIFTESGTFTVPAYVTKVHVVCVGKGGTSSSQLSYGGGGGGALRYGNNIDVSGLQSVPVTINTTNSTFRTVVAGAGSSTTGAGGIGSGGDGGGNGGNGGNGVNGCSAGGGGGAGGYSGAGGYGGSGAPNSESDGYSGQPGAGGGGGGGGGGIWGSNQGSGSGGGVGIYGVGNNGIGGTGSVRGGVAAGGGGGGSGGMSGSLGGTSALRTGGSYGGGMGNVFSGTLTGSPGPGVVRIIWGASRAFPSTNVEKI